MNNPPGGREDFSRNSTATAHAATIPQGFQQGSQPSLADVLVRREARVLHIQSLLKSHLTVVCFKLNIPGQVKNNDSIQALFARGLQDIRTSLPEGDRDWEESLPDLPTGPEYFLASPLPAVQVKRRMVELEEKPLGRLYDLDVFSQAGPLSREELGLPPRTCFLCDRPAPECARSRRHSLAELLSWIDKQMRKEL
ncbi:MAG: citrate lyase holo-[acyl-carrier protein] synthase [Eubacteriales bacterium]|nr:citrate lyase holo-[acyl-carrier protein] synthase [Clostridiales bacterium]MDY5835852.1 citrate lyase holo-[acyl-carrier protein] synthase [Eubacteriales bacterium]